MDFGIARAASSDITRAGAIIGTPEYISPEQILAIKVDHRADIFSLGLVFYEILTRTHPFRSANLPATIHKVLNEKPTPPNELDPQIPKRLSDLVMKAMEKDASSRFQSCKEILQELLDCREELTRQARTLIHSRDILNHESIILIGRLQDLYSRRDFLEICNELNYDPSSGMLSDPPLPQEPTYTQASGVYARAHQRLARAKQHIESSAQIESIMQAGKALYAAGKFKDCIEQMRIIQAYSPGHELAGEYVQQCQHRIREEEEIQERRKYIIQAEQNIMNFFQSGDTTNCQREAMTLLGIDPENSIANTYLRKYEDRFSRAEQESERKRQLESYQEIRASQEYREKLGRPRATPIWVYPSIMILLIAVGSFFWWIRQPPQPFTNDETPSRPKFGSITIHCEPFGNAYIDGQPIGETPIPLRKIPVGQHVITIRRQGFMEVSKTITVDENSVQHLQFALEKEN